MSRKRQGNRYMSEPEKKVEQAVQDAAPDVQDVIIKKAPSKIKKKARAARGNVAILEENKQYLVMFAVIIAALAVILISILGIKIPVVAVCLIVLLEAGIAVCLNNEPIWLHGLVVVAELIAGALCSKLLFMVLCAAIYVVSILALKFLRD